MYLCIFDHAGKKLLHKEVPSAPAALLEALAPWPTAPLPAPRAPT
jgi:hypothetical protein